MSTKYLAVGLGGNDLASVGSVRDGWLLFILLGDGRTAYQTAYLVRGVEDWKLGVMPTWKRAKNRDR